MSGHKKDPSPEFLSFAYAQLEILPSPARGEGAAKFLPDDGDGSYM